MNLRDILNAPETPVLGTALFHLMLLSKPKDDFAFTLTKCLPVWILANQSKNKWMKRGLLLSSLGDALLVYSEKYPPTFLLGLGSFLFAHVLYIKGFQGPASASSNKLAFGSFAVTALLLGGIVIPAAPKEMQIPIGLYGVAIGSMLWKAMDSFVSTGNPKGMLGAITFAISDFSLAYSMFVERVGGSPYIIMSTYYLAQYLIAQVV
jgi:uncharacterized membrane protein YhhN